MKLLIFGTLLFFSNLQAVVWENSNQWDESFELKYREWIKSEEVNPKIFVDVKSPYSGLHLDCADLAYVLRAIFAYENGLPFQVKNPVATVKSKRQYFSNDMDKWDNQDKALKIKSFLTFIANSLGSDTLSFFDTFPVKLDKISSGDIFLFKIDKEDGAIRHTYIIKNVNEKGLFDIIYSTQSVKEDQKMFYSRKNKQISSLFIPQSARGFKRMKWPSHYSLPGEEVIIAPDQSDEQYELAAQMGGVKFFKYLQKLLQVRAETYLEELSRLMADICFSFGERKNVVMAAQKFLTKISNRCMDYQEFDAFSTPNLDNTIIQEYQDLKNKYDVLSADKITEISKTIAGQRLLSFMGEINSDTVSWCSMTIKDNNAEYVLTMKNFVENIIAKRTSFHPNDSQLRRWGLDLQGEATSCKTWYGQE